LELLSARPFFIVFYYHQVKGRLTRYRVTQADLHVSRGIAGKITPAIATTTAMVTAAICVELYKVRVVVSVVTRYSMPSNWLMLGLFSLALSVFMLYFL
jgi:hypothetical protein